MKSNSKNIVNCLLFIACCQLAIPACKKVSQNDDFLHSIYSVIGSGILLREDSSFFNYAYYVNMANSIPLVAGDTLTVAGILGGTDAGREIKIGDSTVALFGYAQYSIKDKNTGTTLVDYMKCRIPPGVNG